MQSFNQRRQIAACVRSRLDDRDQALSPSFFSAHPAQDNGPHNGPPAPHSLSWDTYDNHLNPKNWSFTKKLSATLLVTAISFSVQYASAADSMASGKIEADFFVDSTVESLATGLSSHTPWTIPFKGKILKHNSNL